MKFGIGQSVKRKEDVRLVTGQGRYTDDLKLEGETYAYFVRSPHPHALIKGIDVEAARHASGVIGILTAGDLGDTGTMPVRGIFMPFSAGWLRMKSGVSPWAPCQLWVPLARSVAVMRRAMNSFFARSSQPGME